MKISAAQKIHISNFMNFNSFLN